MRTVMIALLVATAAACGAEDEPGTGGRLRDGGSSTARADAADGEDDDEPGDEQSGEATYYDATSGLGACGIELPADGLVAAINDEQYSKANCGRCASVAGPKGTVVVRVIDKCPGCDRGDLDLSEPAFVEIANKSAGRVKITWRFVTCPS